MPNPEIPNLSPTQQRWQHLALSAYAGLLILTLLWEAWLAPAANLPPGFWLTLKALPLLIPWFGLLHGRPYTYSWACFLVLVYFIEGVVVSYQYFPQGLQVHSPLPYALLEILLSTVFVISASLYARGDAQGQET